MFDPKTKGIKSSNPQIHQSPRMPQVGGWGSFPKGSNDLKVQTPGNTVKKGPLGKE